MTTSKPAIVRWEDSYSIGLPEIDDQHRVLFDIMNRLWSATIHQAGQAELLGIVDQLEKYTRNHFAGEEAFMRALGYPRLEEHRKAHQSFIDRIMAERQSAVSGGQPGLELLRFLNDWLVGHILVTDRDYAESYRRMSQPARLLDRILGRFSR
jgi:hemerythrin-like metal-binding protein